MGTYYEDYLKLHNGLVTCPICGKKFIPAPEHAWKIGKINLFKNENSNQEDRNKLVCTYSCMRKWEKENLKNTEV